EEEGLPPLPVAETFQPRPSENGSSGSEIFAHAFNSRTRAERKAAEVEVAKPQMSDQLAQVAGQDSFRIMLRLVGPPALPMGAKVRHDHAEALGRDASSMAEPDPVHVGVGEQAMKQDDRLAGPRLMPRELNVVGGTPEVGRDVRHPGNSPVASIHFLTSTS